MTDKPKLTLIKKPEPPRANNFWRCCPISKEYLPEAACPQGQPGALGKSQDEPPCPWWINSAEHQYCFWRYVQAKSDEDGVMKELVQSELAALFGWSNTKTHFMLKQAMLELTDALKANGASELLQDLNADDLDNEIVVENFMDFESEDPTE
jgi:hypothetical protein